MPGDRREAHAAYTLMEYLQTIDGQQATNNALLQPSAKDDGIIVGIHGASQLQDDTLDRSCTSMKLVTVQQQRAASTQVPSVLRAARELDCHMRPS